MNIKILSTFFTSLLIAFCAIIPVNAKEGTIFVNATSNLELQPDVAEFNIIITTKDKTSLENAALTNKEISAKIYNDLNTMINKVDGDYLKTIDYSARPTYYYTNGKRNFDRFEVSNTINVHTKKISNVGMLIDKALSLGATNIGNINFTLEDYDTYCNDLLAITTQKAKTKAETIAKASAQKIIGVKELRTSCHANGLSPISRYSLNAKMTSVGASYDSAVPESSTQVQSGAIKLYASVDGDFYTK